ARWARLPALFDAFQLGDWQAAQLARASAQVGPVYLSPELISNPAHPTFSLLLEGLPAREFPGPGCLVYVDRPAAPMTYFVDVLNDQRSADRLARLFAPQAG